MIGDSQQEDESTAGQGQGCDACLTRESRETLANLAVASEAHVEIGDTLRRASRMLGMLAERTSEFGKPSSELCAKMMQLQHLHKELGGQIMRFSHAYEDAVVAAGKCIRPKA